MYSTKLVRQPHGRKQSAKEKVKSIEARIRKLEKAIKYAEEYLETGAHADWQGFRPLFYDKYRKNGEKCPPHPDWVKNVVIPRCHRQIARDMKTLKQLELKHKLSD